MKTAKETAGGATPEGDDRNLLAVDESYEGASFEDRVFLVWKHHKVAVVAAVVIACLIPLGFKVLEVRAAAVQSALRAELAEAQAAGEAALLEFAAAHAGSPQAGIALLQVANARYAAGAYTEAAGHYEKAAESLPEPVRARARLGQAMSLVMTDRPRGIEALAVIATDPQVLQTTRAQAGYNLAVAAWEGGDFKAMKGHLDDVQTLDNGGLWTVKAGELAESVPELRRLLQEEAEAAEAAAEAGGEAPAGGGN